MSKLDKKISLIYNTRRKEKMEIKNSQKQHISPFLLVVLSFIIVMFLGAFLITTPLAQKSGNWGNFVSSVFMSTSATCVTGFDCYPDGLINNINLFGQIVLAICMQIGGLGFMTIFVFFITLFRRKLSFRDRAFLSFAVNSTNIADVVVFVRKIFLTTLLIELLGTLLFLPAFFTIYTNPGEAVWGAVFMSISSFNNAGLDLFGTASLIRNFGSEIIDNMPMWAYYYMCSISMILIIVGGISYLVILEVFSFKKRPSQWSAFTKICLTMMIILNVVGGLLLFFTDGFKGETSMSLFDAFFLAISSKTAGFATYDPYKLSTGGRIISGVLMFIGGSPLGTASGIKTTTLFIILLTIASLLRGKKVHAFKRFFSQTVIAKATCVFIISILIVIIGYFALSTFESNNPFYNGEHALYETVSAFSTTGFTTGMTPNLTDGGKITCVVLMFLGRLGPMTLLSIFSRNMHIDEDKSHVKYLEEDIVIG